MSLKEVTAGRNVPDEINVVIEIPSRSDPVKYEVDKTSGMVMVDRFVATSMHYPCDYGFVPQTLSEDGDPVDVLVVAPYSLYPGVVIRCRPVGMLKMTDDSGPDAKILAVPVDKLTPRYKNVNKPEDFGAEFLATVAHFFEHYKDLEQGKWVKLAGWAGPEVARKEILASIERFNSKE